MEVDVKNKPSSKLIVLPVSLLEPSIDARSMNSDDHEKGTSDMTETDASGSEDGTKHIRNNDLKQKVDPEEDLKDCDNFVNVINFDHKRTSLKKKLNGLSDNSYLDSSDESEEEQIVVTSSGAPDRFRFVTEIFVPKMRGFEELSDRCILDSVSVGLTLDQVVKSSMYHFNNLLKFTDLTDTQLEVTKYVRRRARNRVAARRSRMKKHTDLLTLVEEINEIRKKKEKLIEAYLKMDIEKTKWNQRIEVLQQHIFKELNDRGEDSKVDLEFLLNGTVQKVEAGLKNKQFDKHYLMKSCQKTNVSEKPTDKEAWKKKVPIA